MARRKQTNSVQPAPTIVSVPDPDFAPGDAVRVKGRKGKWVFVARRRSLKSGSEWLDVRGGTPGHERLRSLEPELVGRA